MRKPKALVPILLTLLLAGPAAAECEIETAKDGSRQTDRSILFRKGTRGMRFRFGHGEAGAYLWIQYAKHFSKRFFVDETTPLTLTLDDTTALDLEPLFDVRAKREGGLVLGSKLAEIRYALSAEQVSALAAGMLRGVRITYRERDSEVVEGEGFEIQEKRSAEFRALAACLLEDLGR